LLVHRSRSDKSVSRLSYTALAAYFARRAKKARKSDDKERFHAAAHAYGLLAARCADDAEAAEADMTAKSRKPDRAKLNKASA
jgi:hypothetical protein